MGGLGTQALLIIKDISKQFPGVRALDNASLEVKYGEVHGLVGANGAGKSTLINILAGTLKFDSGNIFLSGKKILINSSTEALRMGIATVYQQFNLVPYLSVGQNIMLGKEPCFKSGVIDENRLYDLTKKTLRKLQIKINVKNEVATLNIAQKQMVVIARALVYEPKIFIMDEPTALLPQGDLNILFSIINKLKRQGISVIFISHRLEECLSICDRITVMKDGKTIVTDNKESFTIDRMVKLMSDKKIRERHEKTNLVSKKEILRCENISRGKSVHNISFKLYKGEILGFAGLVGSGRTKLARILFGVDQQDSGKIILEDYQVDMSSPAKAISQGIGFVTKDRRSSGLLLDCGIKENISLPSLLRISNLGVINTQSEKLLSQEFVNRLEIKSPNINQLVKYLSGGNQQKTVLAKWLAISTKILILDEPTVGIDVATKEEIYNFIFKLSSQGLSLLVISSDFKELQYLSDRILVFNRGKIVAEFNREEMDEEKILSAAIREGGVDNESK